MWGSTLCSRVPKIRVLHFTPLPPPSRSPSLFPPPPLSPRGISPIAPEGGGGQRPTPLSRESLDGGRRAISSPYYSRMCKKPGRQCRATIWQKYFPGYLCEDKNDHSWERWHGTGYTFNNGKVRWRLVFLGAVIVPLWAFFTSVLAACLSSCCNLKKGKASIKK